MVWLADRRQDPAPINRRTADQIANRPCRISSTFSLTCDLLVGRASHNGGCLRLLNQILNWAEQTGLCVNTKKNYSL
jgi:hypothetical protein